MFGSSNKQQEGKGNLSYLNLAPLLSGFVGGASGTILLYPLDLIKVRWQVKEDQLNVLGKQKKSCKSNNSIKSITKSKNKVFPNNAYRKSIINEVRVIIRREGYLGLYQGLSPALIGSGVSWGGYFFLYEGIKQRVSD